jgi:hypothetical protein
VQMLAENFEIFCRNLTRGFAPVCSRILFWPRHEKILWGEAQ